ncbi:hypothetical protein CPC16_008305, partial [Podila verticillata]
EQPVSSTLSLAATTTVPNSLASDDYDTIAASNNIDMITASNINTIAAADNVDMITASDNVDTIAALDNIDTSAGKLSTLTASTMKQSLTSSKAKKGKAEGVCKARTMSNGGGSFKNSVGVTLKSCAGVTTGSSGSSIAGATAGSTESTTATSSGCSSAGPTKDTTMSSSGHAIEGVFKGTSITSSPCVNVKRPPGPSDTQQELIALFRQHKTSLLYNNKKTRYRCEASNGRKKCLWYCSATDMEKWLQNVISATTEEQLDIATGAKGARDAITQLELEAKTMKQSIVTTITSGQEVLALAALRHTPLAAGATGQASIMTGDSGQGAIGSENCGRPLSDKHNRNQ